MELRAVVDVTHALQECRMVYIFTAFSAGFNRSIVVKCKLVHTVPHYA